MSNELRGFDRFADWLFMTWTGGYVIGVWSGALIGCLVGFFLGSGFR